MRRSDEAAFREYATMRMEGLRRFAYLLCRDSHTADDLVADSMVKLYRHFSRLMDEEVRLDSYVRKIIVHTWLRERQRPWRREEPTDVLPEVGSAPHDGVADRAELLDLLDGMPPRQRATAVLRFYCDLSVEETARVLGCTEGNVKSQTARGLQNLRARAVRCQE